MTSAYIHPTIQAQNQSFLYINVKTNRVTKMLQNYIWYFKPSAFPININYIKTCFAMFYTIMYRNVTFVGALIKLQIKWLRFQGKPAHCAPLPAYIKPQSGGESQSCCCCCCCAKLCPDLSGLFWTSDFRYDTPAFD